MAATYRTLAQAQAAYDTVRKQRERAQRNAYIAEQQAVMGVNNYLKQNGYNGGAAETILLRAKSNRPDYSAYDIQLADLAAIIKGFRGAGRGIDGYVPKLNPKKPPLPERFVRNNSGGGGTGVVGGQYAKINPLQNLKF